MPPTQILDQNEKDFWSFICIGAGTGKVQQTSHATVSLTGWELRKLIEKSY